MTRGQIVTLFEFYRELERHDWYYEMSDDSVTWKRGKENTDRLNKMARTSPEHKALFVRYYNYMFSGEPWGTEPVAKPEEPKNTKSRHVLTCKVRLSAGGYIEKKIIFVIDTGSNRAEVTYTNTPIGNMVNDMTVEQARKEYKKALQNNYAKEKDDEKA